MLVSTGFGFGSVGVVASSGTFALFARRLDLMCWPVPRSLGVQLGRSYATAGVCKEPKAGDGRKVNEICHMGYPKQI